MTFTSWQFAIFVGVVFVAYYLPIFRRTQVYLLIAASIFFYGYGQPELLPLLVVAVVGTWAFLVLSFRRSSYTAVGIIFNLGLLAFFKYKFLFFAPPVATGHPLGNFLLNLPLPIGISFFVFHNISLLVDLPKQKRPATVWEIFLYVIFFPQLISGPITQARNFFPQIKPKEIAAVPFVEAVQWLVLGYFFKLYVANNLNEMTLYMAYPLFETVKTADKWLLLFLYSFQIYADFFGYSSIALGLGLLFGYRLPENFNRPYIASSIADFWRRWHISLSSWLRTYLYIPLGGSRHGPTRTYFNLIATMGLGGLWHGAGLSYLVWGLMHGVLLAAERPFFDKLDRLKSPTLTALRALIVFLAVSMLWIFFKLPDFTHAASYFSALFTESHIQNPPRIYRTLALAYSLPVIVQHFIRPGRPQKGWTRALEPFAYGALVALAFSEAGPESAFIYFQF
ncbi:MBOAT family O-acyltransferase [Bradyrhizobium sp. 6(2017)]|uniref:MBOAT family O-acyltransferase n=1 Tax=Bradyrhizobium sp. 6(2017) TaxID=1197460 RepID=UPI0013E1F5CA|nr:MBOAT family protein [Bradyrhizobium sp. 6(2017)]QIG92803.1 MBOAT family protein [Bradyrhizobium sp. 6(2017)]